VPRSSEKFSRTPQVAAVTCGRARDVSGNALLWPGGIWVGLVSGSAIAFAIRRIRTCRSRRAAGVFDLGSARASLAAVYLGTREHFQLKIFAATKLGPAPQVRNDQGLFLASAMGAHGLFWRGPQKSLPFLSAPKKPKKSPAEPRDHTTVCEMSARPLCSKKSSARETRREMP
jgi:hypothetical protein